MSCDELCIMYCASQNHPVNGATFVLDNFDRITQTAHAPILIGGLVTVIANAIGLRQPILRLKPYGGIRPMNIESYFNTSIIENFGPNEFDFLINQQVVHQFSLPNPITSVHNRNNWLFGLDGPLTPPTPETP